MIIKEKHVSPDTAILVNDYPYGFSKRCMIKFWIDTNERGDRFMAQTRNPDTGVWNTPKASTYYAVCILTKNELNGHIEHWGLSPNTTDYNEVMKFVTATEGYEFNNYQNGNLKLLKAGALAHKDMIQIWVNLSGRTEEQRREIMREQEKLKLEADNLKFKIFREL